MKTNVYIDGFNLYYGAIRGGSYKWLNLSKFCQFMLPTHNIGRIKYYTALIKNWPSDQGKSVRQQTYIRALRTIPNIDIVYGHFLSHVVDAFLANPVPEGPRIVRIVKTEEKGSDVNLASHLLFDAFRNEYDVAAIISNDSDLCEPLRIIKEYMGKGVVLINPQRDRHRRSRQLAGLADDVKTIKPSTLKACQFPDVMTDGVGAFQKPACW